MTGSRFVARKGGGSKRARWSTWYVSLYFPPPLENSMKTDKGKKETLASWLSTRLIDISIIPRVRQSATFQYLPKT